MTGPSGCAARRAGAALALAAALGSSSGRAEEAPPGSAPPPPSPAPRPALAANKPRMSAEDLAGKVDGRYVTGLPLANRDPDTGFGFGARVLWFDNGERTDPLFAVAPYRHRVFAQGFATTKGYQYHWLDWDAPYLAGMPIRLRASFVYERNIAANYFGLGSDAMGRLAFPGAPGTYASYSDYEEALREVRPGGAAYTRYDQYILDKPTANLSVERDLFGGTVRVLGGFNASWAGVRQWTDRAVDAVGPGGEELEARQAPTRLDEDCRGGRLVGCDGGFSNTVRLGVAYDTRDFEPDPNRGVFVELTGALAHRAWGSAQDWARVTFAPRVYVSPFPQLADLVVAARLVTSVQSRETPFFAQRDLSFADYDRQGLGGLRTLRGFKQDRYVGPVSVLANVELRWTFLTVRPLRRQTFAFILAPFLDVGRAFDSIDDLELRRFRNGQGVGLRVAWNQATIIVVDYGVSREMTALYVNFNHPF